MINYAPGISCFGNCPLFPFLKTTPLLKKRNMRHYAWWVPYFEKYVQCCLILKRKSTNNSASCIQSIPCFERKKMCPLLALLFDFLSCKTIPLLERDDKSCLICALFWKTYPYMVSLLRTTQHTQGEGAVSCSRPGGRLEVWSPAVAGLAAAVGRPAAAGGRQSLAGGGWESESGGEKGREGERVEWWFTSSSFFPFFSLSFLVFLCFDSHVWEEKGLVWGVFVTGCMLGDKEGGGKTEWEWIGVMLV